jgi:Fe-S cluster assembly protein SufB
MESESNKILDEVTQSDYKYGFVTDIETEFAPTGLSEDTIRYISTKKSEPEFMLEFRLKAYRHWLTLSQPEWAHLHIEPINFQEIIFYAAPKKKKELTSLDEVDPELLATFNKLGISLDEQKKLTGVAGVAVDAVIDSVSVKTTFSDTLSKHGIIFCSFSEAVHNHPDLVKQYMGSVVPYTDNYFAALNSAVFSDGSFCFIPKGVRCPMEFAVEAQKLLAISLEGSVG